MRKERKGERLSLTDLLAKPHQRIPRYRLLIQRLLEHTDPEHSDYLLLRRAERQIHELALQISSVEKEATEQEIRQGVLKRLELIVHGLAPGDLASQSRTLVRQDLVSSSTTTWIRKERCIFLFSDLLLITTVSRRGTRSTKEGKKSVIG
ncbi:rho guanine nucleotide exchange factor osg-1 [Eurytemora carolleeae]|uniref:rho guanine nucleotide exchange factor osg-1 n=1 Tax=Eurytemora carolleeae TaxID=1294199 RepID=UPI000C76E2B7|nr:rho guanine nucleotide exchange factor osg-1 [Eurytemora carolleeae]|eukprot:XP_023326211.1 rho guanine nucleotide exchange factor osg-1-like [Eurytemora affinis]